jgi:DNA-binding MarR family transcriptional regulator
LPGSTLTSVIDRLEQRGLINRVVSKRNRRSYALELTQEDIRISALHEAAEKILWGKLLGSLSDDNERDTFIGLMERISKGIE